MLNPEESSASWRTNLRSFGGLKWEQQITLPPEVAGDGENSDDEWILKVVPKIHGEAKNNTPLIFS